MNKSINNFIDVHQCNLIDYEAKKTLTNELKNYNISKLKIDYNTEYLNQPKIIIKFKLKFKKGFKRIYLKIFFYSFIDDFNEFIESWIPNSNDINNQTLDVEHEINVLKNKLDFMDYFGIFISDKQRPKKGTVKKEILNRVLVISKYKEVDKEQFNTDQDTKDNLELLINDENNQIKPVEPKNTLIKELASVNYLFEDLEHIELSTVDESSGITKNIQKDIVKGDNSENHLCKEDVLIVDDLLDYSESKELTIKEGNERINRNINILEHNKKMLQGIDTTLLDKTLNSKDIDNQTLKRSDETLQTQINELKIAKTKLEDEINQKVQLQINRLRKTCNEKFKGINQLLIRTENELQKEIDSITME